MQNILRELTMFKSYGFKFYLTALILIVVSGTAYGQKTRSLELSLFPLKEGVQAPFPGKPTYMGSLDQGGVTQFLYQFSDEDKGMGYTASIMEMPFFSGLSVEKVQTALKHYLEGTAESMGGTIVSEQETVIANRPARSILIHMHQYWTKTRSHTLAVYDEGRIHTWAIQDAPALSDNLAVHIFNANFNRLSFEKDNLKKPSHRELILHTLPSGVALPFPGTPKEDIQAYGPGFLRNLIYNDQESNILYQGSSIEGFPANEDPAISLLRGAAHKGSVLEFRGIEIDGWPAFYHVLEEKDARRTLMTYRMAFEKDGKIYSWAVIEDTKVTGGVAKDIFFREIFKIKLH